MSDLLKEAIADAKAVRETALENAKIALQEAFAPQLKSMLSAKLAEDDMEDEDEMEVAVDDEEMDAEDMARYGEEEAPMDDMEMDDEAPMDDEEVDESEIIEIDGVKYAPVVAEEDEEMPMDDEEEFDGEENLDLEAVIKELEQEISETEESDEETVSEGDEDEELEEYSGTRAEKRKKSGNQVQAYNEKVEEEVVTEEEDEEEEIDEQSSSSNIGKGDNQVKQASASDEEDPGKGQVHEQVEYLQFELYEYKEAVTFLREKLHEVNILNAKLLYTNKLFKEYALTNEQKLKIVETFDRAQTTREIKLVYSTLAESMQKENNEVKSRSVQEAASRKTGSTKPTSKKIITEESEVASRFKKLAGILKN